MAQAEKFCVSLQRQTIRRSGKLLWSPLELFFCQYITNVILKILRLPSGDTETPPKLILWIV